LLINKPNSLTSLPAVQEETNEATEEDIQEESSELVMERFKTNTADTIDLESEMYEDEKEEDLELICIKSQVNYSITLISLL
jgi:hypothetical protein